ncbi:Protein of unknown function [Pyronema omphalodes CBS 100304]|uniref:Uncharacterized protein n=1 Tax=Pyronema omphalodes (strain CBS 100304) TaxID=1076935 RepID=U4LGC2_PYROM|nr:Protein of unknown function [Pyronema omphalodes CBS 100304]
MSLRTMCNVCTFRESSLHSYWVAFLFGPQRYAVSSAALAGYDFTFSNTGSALVDQWFGHICGSFDYRRPGTLLSNL